MTDHITFQAFAPDLPSADAEKQCMTQAACTGVTGVEPPADLLAFRLSGPSPFCGRTQLSYTLSERSAVRVEVFSITGQRVRTLVNETQPAGQHSTVFAMRAPGQVNLRAGVYKVRLTAGGAIRTLTVIGLN